MNLQVFDYVREHGRLPRMGEKPEPWEYRGWILPYVVQLHAHPGFGKPDAPQELPPELRRPGCCPDRWGYYQRTIRAGKLLDEPIPQINFCGEHSSGVKSWTESETKGMGALTRIVENHVSTTAFRAIVDWIAFGLAVDEEPGTVLKDEQLKRLYQTFNVEPLLLEPSDYLGQFLAASKVNKYNTTGFYPTPHTICEFMTKMTVEAYEAPADDPRDRRVLSIADPCVGTGRFLLHASNYSFNLHGMDIDPVVIKIAKINGALYAPWMTWPLPESIIGPNGAGLYVGNSLLMPMTEKTSATPETPPVAPAKKSKTKKRDQGDLFD